MNTLMDCKHLKIIYYQNVLGRNEHISWCEKTSGICEGRTRGCHYLNMLEMEALRREREIQKEYFTREEFTI